MLFSGEVIHTVMRLQSPDYLEGVRMHIYLGVHACIARVVVIVVCVIVFMSLSICLHSIQDSAQFYTSMTNYSILFY